MAEALVFKKITGSHGDIGHITLNNPKALNALNIDMIHGFQTALDTCENDPNIKAVFVEGAGDKAFCAGGDVIGLYDSMKSTDQGQIPHGASDFFSQEYRLDHRLHTFTKPIISWGDGIVMGGGIGVAAACSHRIVTEKSMFAMPEVTIGLYPDVGASWFFNRMPANIGLFLGLTGARINASDAIYAKLADEFLFNEDKLQLIEDLSHSEWANPFVDVSSILKKLAYERKDSLPVNNLRENYDLIQTVMNGSSISHIVKQFRQAEPTTQWMTYAKKGFLKGCPVTYKLVFEQIRRAKFMSLKEVFKMELIMSTRCAMSGDLQEGIRALLVDKDGQPQWSVTSVDDIDQASFADFFVAPWSEGHPLKDL